MDIICWARLLFGLYETAKLLFGLYLKKSPNSNFTLSCELFGLYWGIFRLFVEDLIHYVWTLYSYLLLFFKMDSSSECATKLDYSNESNPPPVNGYKGADAVVNKKKKAFDSNWPFENYRSRLSEAEVLIFENKKNSQWVKSWVIFRRYGLLNPINFALIMFV